jgi:hypothetical protein
VQRADRRDSRRARDRLARLGRAGALARQLERAPLAVDLHHDRVGRDRRAFLHAQRGDAPGDLGGDAGLVHRTSWPDASIARRCDARTRARRSRACLRLGGAVAVAAEQHHG